MNRQELWWLMRREELMKMFATCVCVVRSTALIRILFTRRIDHRAVAIDCPYQAVAAEGARHGMTGPTEFRAIERDLPVRLIAP